MIKSNIKAIYKTAEEIKNTSVVDTSNTPGAVNQEDNVSDSLFCAFWEKEELSSK